MNRTPKPDLTQPCPHPAGSDERIECYRQRLELGLSLNQPGDSSEQIPPTCGSVNPRQRHYHPRRTPPEVEPDEP